jgi:hypothetical protein
MPAGGRMKNLQIGLDRGYDAGAVQRLGKVLYDLDESLKGIYPSVELTASCEAFRRAMRDIDANVRRMSRPPGKASLLTPP